MGLRTRNIAKLLEQCGELSVLAVTEREWSEEQIAACGKNFNFLGRLEPRRIHMGLIQKLEKEVNPSTLFSHPLRLLPEDQAKVDSAIEAHGAVWIHTLKLANVIGRYHWPRSVMDVDDYPSQFHRTVARSSRSLREKIRRLRLAIIWGRREKKCLERFGSLVVCKEEDRFAFEDPERVFAVTNGFERLNSPRNPIPERPRFGIIGNFNYLLNTNAVDWFLQESWSLVRAKLPNAELRLVGRGSDTYSDSALNVYGLGFIDDPSEELASWNALVVPTRMGGGTSVKVAEAFSRKLPVVATSHGIRGYDVRNGKQVMIADEPRLFASACVQLANDHDLASRLSQSAWEYFDRKLAWDNLLPKVKSAIESAQKFD